MATRELSSVDVQERDDLDRVLDELAAWRGTTIALDIASEADVLNSAAEYEELAAAAQTCDVQITIATDDPLRQELALIYGLGIASNPDATTSILRRRDLQTTVIRPAAGSEKLGVSLPRPNEAGSLLAPRGGAVLDPDASYSFVVAPPAERRPRFSDTADVRPPAARRERRGRRTRQAERTLGASALVVSGIVVAVAIAVLLVGLLAPSARIVLVPETRAISSQLTYGIAAEGAALDVALAPTILSEVLTYEASAPATGERQVPDEAARGMVFLTNPEPRSVLVPAGTTVTSLDGSQAFLTVAPIEVPPADPFGAATFGTAVVDVSAVEPGPAGNLDTGALAGELDNGLRYQNRFPLEGGTLRTETFVTQEDLDKLAARAQQELGAQVDTALDGAVQPGWLMIGGPETPEGPAMTFSAEAGAVADDVSIQAELRVEGRAYDPEALRKAAEVELERRLGAATPEGYSLLLDSVAHSAPEPAGEGASVAYVMRSEATIEAYIDPAIKAELAGKLAGKSEAAARRTLDGIPGLASYQVEYGPEWLPWEPRPQFENRISVDIDAS